MLMPNAVLCSSKFQAPTSMRTVTLVRAIADTTISWPAPLVNQPELFVGLSFLMTALSISQRLQAAAWQWANVVYNKTKRPGPSIENSSYVL